MRGWNLPPDPPPTRMTLDMVVRNVDTWVDERHNGCGSNSNHPYVTGPYDENDYETKETKVGHTRQVSQERPSVESPRADDGDASLKVSRRTRSP